MTMLHVCVCVCVIGAGVSLHAHNRKHYLRVQQAGFVDLEHNGTGIRQPCLAASDMPSGASNRRKK